MKAPAYDLRAVAPAAVAALWDHHAYKSAGRVAVYCFAVYESGSPVAAFMWQPPAPGAARAVQRDLPHGVLALSRMVAVPREQRTCRLRNPLRKQMRALIDRTRWPVLVTYSDEGAGHTGYLYKITGWTPTTRRRVRTLTVDGARRSRYSNGASAVHAGAELGWTWIQRWEHRIADPAATFNGHWQRVPVPGRFWASGAQAHTYERKIT